MVEKTKTGEMPRMVPDRDDIRTRHQTHTDRKPPSRPPEEPSGSGTSWVMITLLIVAGIGICVLALQQYSLSQTIASYEERLELADNRIVSLEKSLTETDESVAFNGTAINAQFKAIKAETDLHMAEIRKLWDVTNKRNKKWIEENQASLKASEKSVSKLSETLTALQKSQASDEKVLSQLTAQLDAEKGKLSSIQEEVASVSGDMSRVSDSVSSLLNSNMEEKMLTLTLSQEDLLSGQGILESKVSDQNAQFDDVFESLKAVNAGRLETSQRLSALTSQIETLNARINALTGSQ